MQKARNIAGLCVALFLFVSCAAHGYLGWKAHAEELAKTNAAQDLTNSLKIGWIFGSTAMLTYGAITLTYFLQRMRGKSGGAIFPILVIALIYLGFGIWATMAAGGMHFVLLFVLPAIILLFAAL